jgi:single-strand DNA-binding protein
MNKAIIIGNVGKDPEIKKFDNGQVANLTIATTEKYNKNGEKVELTEWHNIVATGKLSEIIEKWVKKGDKILIEGKIRTRSYEKNGEKRYVTEIFALNMEMLGGKRSPESSGSSEPSETTDLPPVTNDTDLPF